MPKRPGKHKQENDASLQRGRRRDTPFAAAVIRWQRTAGRHHLPWQQQRDPYRVWLSEIMLQQTQVATVIPYYQKFLAALPDVVQLAQAPEEQVMALWSGLGYYSRARNLHRCARQVCEIHGGQFPAAIEQLEQLPGIGRSTAAAIMVFAFGQREAILDGNVKRVFTRYFGIEGELQASATVRQLWAVAERELAVSDPVAYTQGLMDLGAGCCVRSSPSCEQCPLSGRCVALRDDRVAKLPQRRKRKALQTRQCTMPVILQGSGHDTQVVLVQRDDNGVWPGLLSLPESARTPDDTAADHLLAAGITIAAADPSRTTSALPARPPVELPAGGQWLEPVMHAFTHFRLQINPVLIRVNELPLSHPARWVRLRDIGDAPLPAPVKKLLLRVAADQAG